MPLEIGRTQRPLFSPVLWFVVLLMGGYLLVSLAPDDPARFHPGVAFVVETMAGWIPSIDKWAGYSEFPERTRLLFTYLWLTSPIFLWVVFRWKRYEIDFVRNWEQKSKNKMLLLLLFILFLCGFLLFSLQVALRDTPPCYFYCVNSSEWAQSLVGACLIYSSIGLISLLLWLLRNRKTIFTRST